MYYVYTHEKFIIQTYHTAYNEIFISYILLVHEYLIIKYLRITYIPIWRFS